MAPPRRVGTLLPFVFEEPPDAIFEVVLDFRMPDCDGFFGAVDLTATLWVVEALMDAMVRWLLLRSRPPPPPIDAGYGRNVRRGFVYVYYQEPRSPPTSMQATSDERRAIDER